MNELINVLSKWDPPLTFAKCAEIVCYKLLYSLLFKIAA